MIAAHNQPTPRGGPAAPPADLTPRKADQLPLHRADFGAQLVDTAQRGIHVLPPAARQSALVSALRPATDNSAGVGGQPW